MLDKFISQLGSLKENGEIQSRVADGLIQLCKDFSDRLRTETQRAITPKFRWGALMPSTGMGCFEAWRDEAGTVHIRCHDATISGQADVVIDAPTWVSLVTEMSAAADKAAVHQTLQQLHRGEQ